MLAPRKRFWLQVGRGVNSSTFKTEQKPKAIRVTMSATRDNIAATDSAVSAFLAGADVPLDGFAVRLSLREALLNAVVHGSNDNPQRRVAVDVELDETGLVAAVEDEGPGFAWQHHDASCDDLGDNGRGLALMRMYTSNLAFNACGNRVVLRRDFDAPTGAPRCR